jgi:hypothetical protein
VEETISSTILLKFNSIEGATCLGWWDGIITKKIGLQGKLFWQKLWPDL